MTNEMHFLSFIFDNNLKKNKTRKVHLVGSII